MSVFADIFAPITVPDAWLCAMAQPGREFYAAATLEEDNFEVYLPLTQAPNNEKRFVPLFGNYFFVKLCSNYVQILKSEGIAGIISQNNEPVPIRAQVISELRSREQNGIIPRIRPKPPICGYKRGDLVRCIDGAQAGLFGVFEQLLSSQRARVALSAMGRTTVMNVPLAGLALRHAV